MLPEYHHFLGLLKRSVPELWANLHEPDFSAGLLLRWCLQALLISFAILAADWFTGAGLLSACRVRVPARLRPLAILSTGLGVQGLAIFALGLAGWLTPRAVALVCAGLALVGLAAAARSGRWRAALPVVAWPGRHWWPLLLALPLALLWVFDLMQPVAEGDSTMYHLAAARWYRQHAALAFHPDLRFNSQPHLSVLLYLRHWMLAGDDTLLKLFNLELALLLALAIGAGLKELRVNISRWLALLLVVSSPVFVWMLKIEYADLMLAAFVSAGAVLLLAALRRRSVALVVLAGVALATAGATKLQGLIEAAVFLFAFALVAWRSRWAPSAWMKGLAGASAAIVLWGAGWWLRSLATTGSPAFPFFTGDPELGRLMAVNQTYGFGHGPLALLLLPWRAVTVRPVHFADAFTFGPALLLMAASTVALVWRRRWTPGLAFLGLCLGLFFAFWFFTGQVMRYWASTLGLQAVWITAGLAVWLRRFPVRIALAVPLAVCAALNVAITSPTLRNGWPPPVTWSQKETVQAESLRYYRAARTLNRLAAPQDRVYALHAEEVRFHLTRPNDGDWFGRHSYFWLAPLSKSEEHMVGRLREAGYRFLLLDRARCRERAGMFGFDLASGELMRVWGSPRGTRRVYDDGQYAAFEILPQ